MCMNCGCGQPHDDHGKLANITAADLLRASDANDQTMRESARHITETLDRLIAGDRPAPARPTDRRDRPSIWASPSARRPPSPQPAVHHEED
jgi:hypothetical protein